MVAPLLMAGTASAQELLLSRHGSDLQKLVNAAQGKDITAIIDKSITIRSTVFINGNIKLKGIDGTVLTNEVKGKSNDMILLGKGTHDISNFSVKQHPNGTAFKTVAETGIHWLNQFDHVDIENGRQAYESSRGGKSDAWNITVWKNSKIRTAAVAISIFSQDGPYKALHLEHMDIANGKQYGNHVIDYRNDKDRVTHTLYCHPNVSLDFNDVRLEAGRLALHHFSGGGVPGKNTYVKMHAVKTVKGALEMASPETGAIIITDSELAPYTTAGVAHPLVNAKNSTFKNMGNGIMLRGKLTNCKGGAWTSPDGPLEIIDCELDEINMRPGGKLIIRNSKVKNMWAGDRDKKFEAEIKESRIENLWVSKPLGAIVFDDKSSAGKVNGSKESVRIAEDKIGQLR